MGQRTCAFVVPRAGQEFTFEDMVSFRKEKRVSSFKLPERLELVQEIPTVGGEGQKADKKQMTAMITEKLRTEGKIK